MSDDRVKIQLLCTGSSEDGKHFKFVHVQDPEFEGDPSRLWPFASYPKKTRKSWGGNFPRVGSVYDIDATDEEGGSVYPGTLSWVSLWHNQELRQTLGALEDARARKRQGARVADSDDWRQSLEPAREAYRGMSNAGRVQLLARIVAYITQ